MNPQDYIYVPYCSQCWRNHPPEVTCAAGKFPSYHEWQQLIKYKAKGPRSSHDPVALRLDFYRWLHWQHKLCECHTSEAA